MANVSRVQGYVVLEGPWERSHIIAAGYVLHSLRCDGDDYGLDVTVNEKNIMDDLLLRTYQFEGYGRNVFALTVNDMLGDKSLGSGHHNPIDPIALKKLRKYLAKEMVSKKLNFNMHYVEFEPYSKRLVGLDASFRTVGGDLVFVVTHADHKEFTLKELLSSMDIDLRGMVMDRMWGYKSRVEDLDVLVKHITGAIVANLDMLNLPADFDILSMEGSGNLIDVILKSHLKAKEVHKFLDEE